jgi:hypothetical protein
MLARFLYCNQLHHDLSKLVSKTEDGKVDPNHELGHVMFDVKEGQIFSEKADSLRALFALAFRGVAGEGRKTTNFYQSLIPLVQITADMEVKQTDAEENTESTPFTPFSPSLTLALQGKSTVSIMHAQLEEIPEFLSSLPPIIRGMIKHFYVTDFNTRVSDRKMLGGILPPPEEEDHLYNNDFVSSMQKYGISLILESYDIERLLENQSISIIHSIEVGRITELTLDIINGIIIGSRRLKSVLFHKISNESISKLFELQQDNFPDLVWGTMTLNLTLSVSTGPSEEVRRFVQDCKSLKKIKKFLVDERMFHDINKGMRIPQFNRPWLSNYGNPDISYEEWLNVLFKAGVDTLEGGSSETFTALNSIGLLSNFTPPKELTIEESSNIDLTFLSTWGTLDRLTLKNCCLSDVVVIPESVKKFELRGLRVLREQHVREVSFDISSEQVFIDGSVDLLSLRLKEGKVKQLSVWRNSSLETIPHSLETLKVGSMSAENYNEIIPDLLKTLAGRSNFKFLEIGIAREWLEDEYVEAKIELVEHPEFSVRYSKSILVYRRIIRK